MIFITLIEIIYAILSQNLLYFIFLIKQIQNRYLQNMERGELLAKYQQH